MTRWRTAYLALGRWLTCISSEWHRPISFTQGAPAYSGCEFVRRSSASTSRPIRATMSGTASTSVRVV